MSGLPLYTLLSQVLVALTIELDNEFEHRMPHYTTNYGGSKRDPWLISLVMWSKCLRFVPPEGVRAVELESLARTKTNLDGMRRWGYVTVTKESLIRLTPAGQKADQIWREIFPIMDKRWQARFGQGTIEQLHKTLQALISQMDIDHLPDCLPVLGYGLFSQPSARKPIAGQPHDVTLPALLSRVLLAFAIEFERDSPCSLAIAANVLRVLTENGVRVRDLPVLSGVSAESINMALGILQKKKFAKVTSDAASRAKLVLLTPLGQEAQEACFERVAAIEIRWKEQWGANIQQLRDLLEQLLDKPRPDPYPECWRARLPQPNTLPHYPMVTHRGGYPDGS